MQQVVEVLAVLHRQALVEPQLLPQGLPGGLRSPGTEQGVDGIAGGNPQQQEHQAGDQPEHHGHEGQAAQQVAPEVMAAAHGWTSSNACRITRPDPSNWGALRFRCPQARALTCQRGTNEAPLAAIRWTVSRLRWRAAPVRLSLA